MPNKKSAERRMHSNARRELYNRRHRTRVRTFEKEFKVILTENDREEAVQAYRRASSALDRAAKTGAIPRERADKKKARLATQLNALGQ